MGHIVGEQEDRARRFGVAGGERSRPRAGTALPAHASPCEKRDDDVVNEELWSLSEADQEDRAGGTYATGAAGRDRLRLVG